ncbi:MAG: GAF domain-containing protein [Magnetococcales bacterium]|nr:GAF domain-containing protein [Magnetococcales bacterium]
MTSPVSTLRDWLLHKTLQCTLLALLCALLVGLLSTHLYRTVMEQDFQILLDGQVQREAARLEMETMRGQAMGVASLFGLNEPMLKELVQGTRPPNDAESLARMKVAREMLGADGIYIMDNRGKIVVHETDHESSVGKNIKFRPYWQQAMAGKENVYPAVGSRSGERGIYVADAIRSGTSRKDAILGVVVIKLLGDQLDQRLTGFGVKAVLLAPQGVVFASTEPEWLFRIHGTPTRERIEAITRLNQFGKTYESGGFPEKLPFDLEEHSTWINGHHFARSSAQIRWNDPAGDWSLVLLGDLEPVTPLAVITSIGLATGSGLFLLLLLALRAFRESHSRRAAVTETRQTAEKLLAEAQTRNRQAEFAAALQQARDLARLAQVWFVQLSGFLPLHQAALYVVEDEQPDGQSGLILAGAFGSGQAPERLKIGDGLVGQCAVDRVALHFEQPREEFWQIGSGLGCALPRRLLLLPVMRSGRLLGVLELASLDPTFLDHQPAIEELMPLLASNLEIVLIAKRTTETLAEAREVESWLLSLIDGVPQPIVVVDEEETIHFANRTAQETFGPECATPGSVHLTRLIANPAANPAALSASAVLKSFPMSPHPRIPQRTRAVIFHPGPSGVTGKPAASGSG